MWLYVSGVSDAGLNYGWWAPLIENGGPIEYFVRYYQLYEVLENGHFGLILSAIPANQTEISGIGNLYSKVVLSAILHDGTEIFSNIVRPADLTKIEDKDKEDTEVGYIYPNPTTGTINIPPMEGEYKVFNLNGQMVMAGDIEPEINVSSLSKGIYIITMENTTKKFIIE